MNINGKHWTAPIALAAATLVAAAIGLGAQTLGEPQHFTATAILGSGHGASMLDINVNRWSTTAERNRLTSTLLDKGQEKLLDVLKDEPSVGYLRTPGSLSWDLRYAQHTPMPDGGERVILATDRPLSFWETARQGRSTDYPFTIIELKIDKNGHGTGTMAVAAKLTADKNSHTIVMENYGLQPIMLENVREQTID